MAGNILGGCLFERVLTTCCSSLLEDTRAILSVQNLHLAVCTSFYILCYACLYKFLNIDNFVFLHFLSAGRLSLFALKGSSLVDLNHGEELLFITFRREGVHDYLLQCAKSHSTASHFQQMKTLKHLKFQH